MKFLFGFLIIFMTAGITVARMSFEKLGISTNILMIALGGVVITWIVGNKNWLFICLIAGLSLMVNFPETLEQHGINPDILFATLVGVILTPLFVRLSQ